MMERKKIRFGGFSKRKEVKTKMEKNKKGKIFFWVNEQSIESAYVKRVYIKCKTPTATADYRITEHDDDVEKIENGGSG